MITIKSKYCTWQKIQFLFSKLHANYKMQVHGIVSTTISLCYQERVNKESISR